MRFFLALCFVCMSAVPALAADKTVTFYLDGARVERNMTASKGYLEVALPADMQGDSLRIKPLGRTSIDRVEIVAAPSNPKRAKELAQLAERKEQLEDRLKALATREEIFTAAAKSQSGKAPRKSKSNPEPLAAIRQGTDFAIAQLETVYHARRKAEKELKSVENRLEMEKKAGNIGGSVARIWLKGKNGRVGISYLVSGLRWTPCYDFRLNGEGDAEVSQRASLPMLPKGATIAVVPTVLAEAATMAPVIVGVEPLPPIAAYKFPVEKGLYSASPQPSFSFSCRNGSRQKLPAGEAACYLGGEYLGKIRFQGLAPGETGAFVCGR